MSNKDIAQVYGIFQSTLLMRGATQCIFKGYKGHDISIHAPHARSDCRDNISDIHIIKFQSTLLMRGATPLAHAAV